ncbi:FAD-LINKED OXIDOREDUCTASE, FAD-LINKED OXIDOREDUCTASE 1 [Hibiscus trionum]|uniref:FAD-LINKED OXIDOREDUCTASE, FAD-LINKED OXIDOREDUCTASE 1 n=1 Tax=Hibiscus trionum TaxID=183268 RepID=A0A9W7IDS7_HIBTR|nr:FAD-LINKED OXIDOREDUCTASE, FAD-LINKED OXIDOREDUCTASE 1 [Hibiscus trionum]
MSDPNSAIFPRFLTLFITFLSLSCRANSQSSAVNNILHCLNYGSDPILSRSIYLPSDPHFQSVLRARIKNLRFLNPETPKPVAIVAPTLLNHVQGAVICARDNGLQIRIRSGGHDYEGLSYRSNVTFIILDMSNFRSIDIDIKNETAWVEAGATLGELYYNIGNKSNMHAFPSGICPTVGIGGHLSGGGYGNLMRKYGLAADNILDVIVVDALGNIHDRASMGEDLFWAIRGGGGASFAVIVSWKINLVRVTETVTVFNVSFTLEQGATDLVYKWQKIAPNINEGLYMKVRLTPLIIHNGTRHGNMTLMASFVGFFLGRCDELLSTTDKSFPELRLTKDDCKEMRWVESTLFYANFPLGTPVDVLLNRTRWTPMFFKNKSDYVKKVITKHGLNKIWEMMIDVRRSIGGKFYMEWNPYGGKMNEIPESNIAFPHRKGNVFLIQYAVSWHEDDSNVSFHNIGELRRFYAAMAPYVSKNPRETFLNYRDLDIGQNPSNETSLRAAKVYGRKYFKDNFTRLTKVKAMVDPSDFFKYEQSIPPIN